MSCIDFLSREAEDIRFNVISASPETIRSNLQDLTRLDETSSAVSMAINWAYWRLGKSWEAFTIVSLAFRRFTPALTTGRSIPI